MPLQTSGQITLNEIHVEAGGTSGTQASINDSDIRDMIGKASGTQMAFNEWYGASSSIFDTTQDASVWGASYHTQNSTYGSASGSGWTLSAYQNTSLGGSAARNHLSGVTTYADGRQVDVEYDLQLSSSNFGAFRLAFSTYARTGFSNTISTSSTNNLNSIETLAYYTPLGYTSPGFWFLDGGASPVYTYKGTYAGRHQGSARITLPNYGSTYDIWLGCTGTSGGGSNTWTLHSLTLKEI